MPLALAQPPTLRTPGGCEADAVLTGIGGAESKLAGVRTFGVDDAVVIVEDFVDGYGDGEVWVCVEDVVLGFKGAVMAYHAMSQR